MVASGVSIGLHTGGFLDVSDEGWTTAVCYQDLSFTVSLESEIKGDVFSRNFHYKNELF